MFPDTPVKEESGHSARKAGKACKRAGGLLTALPTLPALPIIANMLPIKILDRHPLRKSAGLLGADLSDEHRLPRALQRLRDVRPDREIQIVPAECQPEILIVVKACEVLRRTAQIERSLGRWDDALRHYQQAKTLDPGSTLVADELGATLLWLRRYPEAEAEADRTLALDPTDLSWGLDNRVRVSLAQGDLAGARAVLRAASKEIEPADLVASTVKFIGAWVLDDAQQQLLLTVGPDRFDDNRATWVLSRSRTYALRGDAVKSHENAEVARAELAAQLRAVPQDAGLRVTHALALACLGRKAEAIAEGERATQLLPVTKEAFDGASIQETLVEIYVLLGENEKALDRLEPLLKIPFYLSPGWLRIDPTFAPLRGNPRFEKLLKGSP